MTSGVSASLSHVRHRAKTNRSNSSDQVPRANRGMVGRQSRDWDKGERKGVERWQAQERVAWPEARDHG
jgi:hypothetical protein